MNCCKQFQEECDFRYASNTGKWAEGEKCSTQAFTAPLGFKANWEKKILKKSQKHFNILKNILSSLIYHSEQAATLQDSFNIFPDS